MQNKDITLARGVSLITTFSLAEMQQKLSQEALSLFGQFSFVTFLVHIEAAQFLGLHALGELGVGRRPFVGVRGTHWPGLRQPPVEGDGVRPAAPNFTLELQKGRVRVPRAVFAHELGQVEHVVGVLAAVAGGRADLGGHLGGRRLAHPQLVVGRRHVHQRGRRQLLGRRHRWRRPLPETGSGAPLGRQRPAAGRLRPPHGREKRLVAAEQALTLRKVGQRRLSMQQVRPPPHHPLARLLQGGHATWLQHKTTIADH